MGIPFESFEGDVKSGKEIARNYLKNKWVRARHVSWKLSRPSALPVIFKAAVEMTAAQSENRVGSPYSPEHTRSFEAGADHSLAARFDHTRANKQMLAPKLGISHTLRIPRKVVRFRAYLLGNVGIVSIDGT